MNKHSGFDAHNVLVKITTTTTTNYIFVLVYMCHVTSLKHFLLVKNKKKRNKNNIKKQ